MKLPKRSIAALFDFLNGKSIKPGGEGEIPVYGSNGIIGGTAESLYQDAVVIGRVGAYCGSVAYCRGPFWASDNTIVAAAKDGQILPRFGFYLLKSMDLNRWRGGAAQPLLTHTVLRGLSANVPEIVVQERILHILTAYDDLIENNTKRIEILEEMARSLFREWFINFRFPGHEKAKFVRSPLGKAPDGWPVVPFDAAVDISPRTEVPKEGEKPFLPMTSLSNDSMLISQVESREGNSGAKFKNGDTLFARITPCLENGKTGFVQFLSDDAVGFGSTEFIVLREKLLTREMVYLLAREPSFRDHAIKSMSGASGRQRVQEKCFATYLVAAPPREVARTFSALASPLFRQVYVLAKRNDILRDTRDLLLPRLISGEIDVSSLPAEPAAS
ncbi:MAG TPA: restriction endonuclease subunit S [Polyangia bacterium]|jgi:Restriction endonuclease S subunits|nr:restriction endonuclease subunit S [Polyangia bacterium]